MTGIELTRVVVEICTDAMRHNMHRARTMVGPDNRFFAVIKGDGYGVGALAAAQAAASAGADALAIGDPAILPMLRAKGVTLPVLLYPCLAGEQIGNVASPDTFTTIHDMPSLEALAAISHSVNVYLKLECGNGRLGVAEHSLPALLERLKSLPQVTVCGVYAQFRDPGDSAAVARQAGRFERMVRLCRENGLSDMEVMVSSSILVTDHPELNFTAVNPGRMLFGFMDPARRARFDIRPVFRSVRTLLIQVREPDGQEIAYGAGAHEPGVRRVGVIPAGFMDGFEGQAGRTSVLVGGRFAPVLGRSSMEHTVLDLTGINAAVGDEVVLLGKQGDAEIDMEAFASGLGGEPLHILPRLGRMARRRYITSFSACMTAED